MVSICAIIAVRNEAPYLRVLLPILADQQIEVAILDNDSTDDSYQIYSLYKGNPITLVKRAPYEGSFSLTKQLEEKNKIIQEIDHDWIIHHDADEVFEHIEPHLTLRDAIEKADQNGYTALNFDEFVFLPEPKADYSNKNYYKEMLRYYYFAPGKNRLNRVWKHGLGISNVLSGGHSISGGHLTFYPKNHILRHYITVSYQHVVDKYTNRIFSAEDLNKGWHKRRLKITKEKLVLPFDSPYLFQLETCDSKEFHREKPTSNHYWEWV